MEDVRCASEELVYAWQALSSSLWSNRFMKKMTFNEINVCSLLNKWRDENVTATELCQHTGLLKSQMNRVLSAMEAKGYLCRVRSETDHRLVFLRLLPTGETVFLQQREEVLRLVDEVVREFGVDSTHVTAQMVQRVAKILRKVMNRKE